MGEGGIVIRVRVPTRLRGGGRSVGRMLVRDAVGDDGEGRRSRADRGGESHRHRRRQALEGCRRDVPGRRRAGRPEDRRRAHSRNVGQGGGSRREGLASRQVLRHVDRCPARLAHGGGAPRRRAERSPLLRARRRRRRLLRLLDARRRRGRRGVGRLADAVRGARSPRHPARRRGHAGKRGRGGGRPRAIREAVRRRHGHLQAHEPGRADKGVPRIGPARRGRAGRGR